MMKKVLVLLVGSLMMMSCGEKPEPTYVKSVDERMIEYNTEKVDSCLTYLRENDGKVSLEETNKILLHIKFYQQELEKLK